MISVFIGGIINLYFKVVLAYILRRLIFCYQLESYIFISRLIPHIFSGVGCYILFLGRVVFSFLGVVKFLLFM